MSTLEEVRKIIEASGIRTVILMGTDPSGVQRGRRMGVSYFLKAAHHGITFASFIMGTTTVDDVLPGLFDTGIPDVRGIPDLSSFRVAPWEPDTAVCLMDWARPDGEPHPCCPRSELKRQVARVAAMGLEELMSLELEFFVFPTPVAEIRRGQWADIRPGSRDIHCYSIYEGHFWEPLVSEIRRCFDDSLEGCTPEWGPGQFEINLYRNRAVAMADTAVLFKTAVKQLAAQRGLAVTFMAKWHENESGNSGHIHQSLRDARSHEPVFFDAKRKHRISEICEHYTAGQLEVFRPATLFFAPNANSYKRFQPMSFAGSNQTWGIDNRTVTLRIINESASACRLENRVGGADLNPYVAFAACLGAGLRGIERRLALPEIGKGNCYEAQGVAQAPTSLEEAAEETDRSPASREVLSCAMVDNLVRIARFEAGVHRRIVTDLDRRRYFEMA